MDVKIKLLNEKAKVPTYATDGSGAFDFYLPEDFTMDNFVESKKIPLGIAMEVPKGHVLILALRSSMGSKTSLRLSNSIGIIDSDYRGEICVLFDNIGADVFLLESGDRIAQGFILPVPRAEFKVVDELSDTARGVGGFGSTGGYSGVLAQSI